MVYDTFIRNRGDYTVQGRARSHVDESDVELVLRPALSGPTRWILRDVFILAQNMPSVKVLLVKVDKPTGVDY